MRNLLLTAILLNATANCRAELGCFRSVAEAVAQAGVRENTGFRLESVRHDPFGGKTWASVRSCTHPERPPVTVAGTAAISNEASHAESTAPQSDIVMRGGARVRVLKIESTLRLDMPGIAQSSGRVGDRVRVRILSPGGDGIGSLVTGVVRSADCLEITQ